MAMLLVMYAPLSAQAQDTVNNNTLGTNRYHQAESLLKRSLETRERTLGKEHPYTLATVNSLALLYKAEGRYSEAEQLYRRSLEASERTLGKEHPFTLATVNSLALLYKAQSRHGEAEPLYQRVQEAREHTPEK